MFVPDTSLIKNIFLISLVLSYECYYAQALSDSPVTCGSVVKLIHKDTGHLLHSHEIAWGSGSAQQSVTATGTQNDKGSLWLIKESSKGPSCEIGVPIKCGDIIRLEHVSTSKNLHSHLFKAALSGNQEVSAFGDGGKGDTGDNWVLECSSKDDNYWNRGAPISLKHVDTKKYLYSAENVKFNQQNCGMQCPIMGQTEVSVSTKKDSRNRWATGQGVYFPIKDADSRGGDDDEEKEL